MGGEMAKSGQWTEKRLNPLTIDLDVQNPRIEVPDGATQAEIRDVLLGQEDVVELAREIVKSEGLFYGDRVITTLERGKQVVLEGNRRVTACQLLLQPSLIPSKYKSRFPIASAQLKKALKTIPADVAPSRAAADPILTKRHTERGIKPWTPLAKMRRAARWVDGQGLSFEDAAQRLGTTAAQVRRTIRPYRLLKAALEMDVWTDQERQALEGENLVVNPYTRFFTLKDTRDILGLSFDKQERATSTLPPKVFNAQLAQIVRDFLIPDTGKSTPRENTRTEPQDYFKGFLATPAGAKSAARVKAAAAAKKKTNDTRSSAAPRTPRASAFFEKLVCEVDDDNLIKLAVELTQINHVRMPIAASVLLRATLECALRYKIKTSAKAVWQSLVAKKQGRDPELGELLSAAANKGNAVFDQVRICDILASQQTRDNKAYLDSVVHNHWRQADAGQLESAANNLRNVVSYILEGN
jgi:hypothetical protein